jgi:hypothetical protein
MPQNALVHFVSVKGLGGGLMNISMYLISQINLRHLQDSLQVLYHSCIVSYVNMINMRVLGITGLD